MDRNNTDESQASSSLGRNGLIDNLAMMSSRLLERNTTPIYTPAAKILIKDKVVLVTGAGGSIGSEIIRQLRQLGAGKIICVDNDEFSLYKLSLEFNGNALLTEDTLILADIKDKTNISRIFAHFCPEIVYHAAAHKHLPLLERSPVAAIKNNVIGTDNIVSLCVKHEINNFVNISTDKAANPVSVLGASKRLAEYCTAKHKKEFTKVASVRFGNVLGSRGSFLPTFVWQIENDIPVTITHSEVSRYFMTIPEAASLVIEASALSHGGETYVLDMGKPIKIMDLVSRYIKLTGCQYPKVIYSGLRPGEKLCEELFDPSEIHLPTTHPLITQVNVDQKGGIMPADKRRLRSLIRFAGTPETVREGLIGLVHTIETRHEAVKKKQTYANIHLGEIPV